MRSLFTSLGRVLPKWLRPFRIFILYALWACAPLSAHAGSISFGLSQSEDHLTLTNQGDSTAYYTVAARLLASGDWAPLPALPGETHAAELAPGADITLQWEPAALNGEKFAAEEHSPILVSFYDQAGGRFEQITFLRQPPPTGEAARIDYTNGVLTIERHGETSNRQNRHSWLLWAQAEGVGRRSDFGHPQKHALKINWAKNMELKLSVGEGLTDALLLHENDGGHVLEQVNLTGTEPSSICLNMRNAFWGAAAGLVMASSALFITQPRLAGRKQDLS